MANLRVAIPGIGGSLGECVVCGGTFTSEILLGRNVSSVNVKGFGPSLPVHEKCLNTMLAIKDGNWRNLPDGPLRKCFAEANEEIKQSGFPTPPCTQEVASGVE